MVWAGYDALVLLFAAVASVVLFQRTHDAMSVAHRVMLVFFAACCVTYMWQEVKYAQLEWQATLSQIGLHGVVTLFLSMRAYQARPRPIRFSSHSLTYR